jgi:hypothetical protein
MAAGGVPQKPRSTVISALSEAIVHGKESREFHERRAGNDTLGLLQDPDHVEDINL